jgi:ribosomal protein S18 acetylase RimI-like enzyme
VGSEAVALQRALVSTWARMYEGVDGARFEPRSDLIVAVCPEFPMPQCNGPWVVEDTEAAVAALPAAIAEAEAAGASPWVQSRSGYERTQAAARELGLTELERLPGMVVRPGELSEVDRDLEIGPIADEELGKAIAILAVAFGAPEELLVRFAVRVRTMPEAMWYVGRVDDTIVSTALGLSIDGVTGIFNVATPSEHRGRGYGTALTAHAVRDGFNAGSEFAFLQSSELGHTVYRQLGFRDVEEYVLQRRPPKQENQ